MRGGRTREEAMDATTIACAMGGYGPPPPPPRVMPGKTLADLVANLKRNIQQEREMFGIIIRKVTEKQAL